MITKKFATSPDSNHILHNNIQHAEVLIDKGLIDGVRLFNLSSLISDNIQDEMKDMIFLNLKEKYERGRWKVRLLHSRYFCRTGEVRTVHIQFS